MTVLRTARLELQPMTFAMVEAVLQGRREDAEAIARAAMPARWPNRELIERAFSITLESIREAPERRLWGARVMVASPEDAERRVIGSIVFHGAPEPDGTSEIAYGVDAASQGRGYATEAVGASVAWALEQPGVRAVRATTFGWHRASVRVLEKVGMVVVDARQHETMGEMIVFERTLTPEARSL
ncbi:MAG: GNAT family N-acetyltransferase [Polyangiaceae bacterium]|nr:GNAT family N-acetyltransferase [Polyangiaceae bacterium]